MNNMSDDDKQDKKENKVAEAVPSSHIDNKTFTVGSTWSSSPIFVASATPGTASTASFLYPSSSYADSRIDDLSHDLDNVQKQLSSIQKDTEANAQLSLQVHSLTSLVEQAQAKSKELKAPVLLPPIEDMEVRLVASHSLERLEEYRSDESKYYLLIGLFGGAVLGILSNWVTNEQFTITRFSIVFIILLLILTLSSAIMAYVISRRASSLKSKIFHPDTNNPESES